MTDDEILVTVQEVHPHITLRLQRLLWYGSMLRRSCPTFWALLAYEQWWLQRIAEDMDWFYSQLVGYTWLPDPRVDLEAWHLLATQQPSRWKKLLKRARLHALWQHTVHYNVDRYHRKAFDLLIQAGASLPSTVQEEVERAHYCFICQRTFATHRSWAVHSFKLHQRINKWRRLQSGEVCLACGKRFPSEARLIRHLQSVRACANTVASQRIWAPQRPAFGSTQVTTQERSLLLSTWEHTETPCLPAAAGWTMTWQTRSFLQFCTTVQWTSTDVEHQCLLQLQQHAVCGQELVEIEEALEITLQCDEQKAAMHAVFTCLKNMARPQGQTIDRKVPLQQCVQALPTAAQPMWTSPSRTPTKYRYILHLYAGVRREGDLHTVIANMPSPDGYTFYPASLDIVLCPIKGDLVSPETQTFWIQASQSGAVFAVVGGPPCESWSVARWKTKQQMFKAQSHYMTAWTSLLVFGHYPRSESEISSRST